MRSFVGFVVAISALMSFSSTIATAFEEPLMLKGACSEKSHIAEGLQTEDLTKRQSRFFYNSVVIMHPNDDPKRVLITFAEAQSSTNPQLGFAGTIPEPNMVQVERVYLRSGQPLDVSDGVCKLFRKRGMITSLVCGAKIDGGGRRTVPIAAFNVSSGR